MRHTLDVVRDVNKLDGYFVENAEIPRLSINLVSAREVLVSTILF